MPRYSSERRILCTSCMKSIPEWSPQYEILCTHQNVYNLTITLINAHKRSVVEGFLHFLARLCRSSNSHKPKKIRIRLMWKTSPVNWMKRRIWYYFYSIPLQTCLSRSIAKVLQPRAGFSLYTYILSEKNILVKRAAAPSLIFYPWKIFLAMFNFAKIYMWLYLSKIKAKLI